MGNGRTFRQGCARFMRGVAWVVLILLLVGAAVCAALWHERISVASRLARKTLDEQGLEDITFRVALISPWRVVVEDIRWGDALSIDWVDIRFSLNEIKNRHVERVHVYGMRTALIVGDGMPVSPLAEKIKPLLPKWKVEGSDDEQPLPSFWMLTMRDMHVDVMDAKNGTRLTQAVLSAGGVAEQDGGYRVWGQARAAVSNAPATVKISGSVSPLTGAVTVAPEVSVADAGAWLALARRLAPGLPPDGGGIVPTACGVTGRGSFSVTAWTNVEPFEVSAELVRGSSFAMPAQDAWVKFQSVRMEASGTLDDVQGRVNIGVSGFGVGTDVEVLEEKGRALSLRGTARFRRTATNECVTASLESDLPGRTMAKVLPRVLPLVPVFFSDGGTLKAEAEAERPPQGAWCGAMRYAAETLRSSAPVSGAYVRAKAVRVTGDAEIAESKFGAVRTDIALEDGAFLRDGLAVTGSLETHLTARPPYAEAVGTLKGRISETRALKDMPLALGDGGGVAFEGEAVVSDLASAPVWKLALKVPEFDVAWTQQAARVTCTAGGAADVRYSAVGVSARVDVWARDVAAESEGAYTAGIGRGWLAFDLPEIQMDDASNVAVSVTLGVSNVWANVTGMAELEDAQCTVPLAWSMAGGLSFPQEQALSWQRLEGQGITVFPDGFAWSADGGAVELRAGVRLAESAVRAQALVRVPLANPQDMHVTVTLPETELTADDAVAALVRDKTKGIELTGRMSAEADARFRRARPSVTARARFSDGRVQSGDTVVEGLATELSFMGGGIFRTIERPFVSFEQVKSGNIVLGRGRADFHVTPRGVTIDRMDVACCKGTLNAYALDWDFKNPKAAFTVYADRIDMGEALMMMVPFKGQMEGVLYGRQPVVINNGRITLLPGYLYSLPGQGGKLRLDDPQQVRTLLDQSGIKGDVQEPLSKALSNLDFSMLKFDLEPREDGEGTLRIKLVGKSNDKDWPAPVDLNLNLHGPLEELINTGRSFAR